MSSVPYTMQVKGNLDVLQGATIMNGLSTDTLTASGDTVIQGNLHVVGGAIIQQSSSIAGAQFSTDNTQPQHFDQVTANILTVSQTLTASNALSVSGTSTLSGIVNAGNTLNATNTVNLGASNKTTTIAGAANVAGALTVSNTANLQATTITSLTNTGTSSLNGAVTVAGATAISNTLTAGGTTLSSLSVTGPTQLNSAVTAPSVSVTSLSNSGNTTLSGTLSAGASTVSSLTNTGTTTLNDNVIVAATKSLTVPTITSVTHTNTGNMSNTGTLSSGATTVSSLTNTGSTLLSDNVTIAATKSLTVPTVNSTTINNSGNIVNTGTLSSGATTITSLINTGTTALNDNLIIATGKSITVPVVNSTTLTNSGNVTVAGTFSSGASTVSSLTNTGTTTLNDNVTISASKTLTVPTVNSTTISNTGNASVTGTLTAGSTTLSSLVTNGTSLFNDNVIIAATKSIVVPTVNSTTINNSGNITNTGTLVSGATTISSLINSGTSTLNNDVTIAAGKSLTVPTVNSTTLVNSGNVTVSGTLSAGATTITSLSASGTSTLNDNVTISSTKTLTAGPITNTQLTTSGNASIGGTLTAGNTTVSALTSSGTTTLNGNVSVLSSATLTSGAINATDVTLSNSLAVTNGITTKDINYTGKLYANSALLRFGPAGFDMILPTLGTITASTVTASRIRYTYTPLTQLPFGGGNILLPEVTTLKVVINSVATMITTNPNTISTIDVYSFTNNPLVVVSSTIASMYGYTPGSAINLSVQYLNSVSSSNIQTAAQQTFTTAGVPQAPTAVFTTDTATTALLTATGPSVTDSVNTTQTPQPPLLKYTGNYSEVSSVSASSLTTNNVLSALPSSITTRPGTVLSATAAAYNVLSALPSSNSSVQYISTDYSESRFSTGVKLTNGAALIIPSQYQYATGTFVCRSNTSTPLITKPTWSIVVQNLRSNMEPHPLSTTLAATVLELTHSLSSVDLMLNVYFSDTGPKTITSAPATLSFDSNNDSNTGLYTGFYKQIPNTTLTLSNCAGSETLQTVNLKQIFKQQGSWALSGNAMVYTYGTAVITPLNNSVSFYCDDTAGAPIIQSSVEITASRSVSLNYNSGLATVTALSVVIGVAMTNIGRYWWPTGAVLTATGSATSNTLVNTPTACIPVYNDAACTSVNSGAITQSSNAYRRLPLTVTLSALTALAESTSVVLNAMNIAGSTTSGYTTSVSAFRYDPLIPVTDGTRVVFTAATLYPDVTTASIYDNTKFIVDSDSIYGNELVFYNGMYRGMNDASWQLNFASKGYSMGSATFPNYSTLTSKARSLCFQWYVNSSAMYNTVKVVLNSGSGSVTGLTLLYKFVDLVTTTNTSPWKNLFVPLSGAINSGSDGSGGQYKAYIDAYTTSTVIPTTSNGKIYIKAVMTATCPLLFSGITISDLSSGTLL